MANPFAPHQSRDWASSWPAANCGEVRLQIDGASGLSERIGRRGGVAHGMETEEEFLSGIISKPVVQDAGFISPLQKLLIKAGACLKNKIRRVNKSVVQQVQFMLLMCFSLHSSVAVLSISGPILEQMRS